MINGFCCPNGKYPGATQNSAVECTEGDLNTSNCFQYENTGTSSNPTYKCRTCQIGYHLTTDGVCCPHGQYYNGTQCSPVMIYND